jgi:Zn-dependent protease
MFIQEAFTDPTGYFSWILFVTFSICCHEYAHAATALRMGDDTAARSGHLTLNPLVQMGPQSLIMLILFGLAWGAVPVSPGRVRNAAGRALIALAGPLANLALCALFALAAVLAGKAGAESAARLLLAGGAVNGVLLVFNILPIPGLDGFAALSAGNPALELSARRHGGTVFLLFLLLLWNTPLGQLVFTVGYRIEALFAALWILLTGGAA